MVAYQDLTFLQGWRVGRGSFEVAGDGLASGAVVEQDLMVKWHGGFMKKFDVWAQANPNSLCIS